MTWVAFHDYHHIYMQWILARMHEALKVASIFRTIIFPLAPLTFQTFTYSGNKTHRGISIRITDTITDDRFLYRYLSVHVNLLS